MNERSAIAVGVNSEGKLWTAHFGMAARYEIFDRRGNLLESRANPHARTDRHHDDAGQIVALLPECGVFIARRMGNESRRRLAEEFRVEPVLTEATKPHEAVQAYLHSSGEKP